MKSELTPEQRQERRDRLIATMNAAVAVGQRVCKVIMDMEEGQRCAKQEFIDRIPTMDYDELYGMSYYGASDIQALCKAELKRRRKENFKNKIRTMKKALFGLSVMVISATGIAQKAPENKMQLTITEGQMVSIYQLLQTAKTSVWDNPQLAAPYAKQLSIFADSLSNVFVKQSLLWHPDTARKQVDTAKPKK